MMAFSKMYGLESEIKINRKITKTGSVGRREPENLFGVALYQFYEITHADFWFPYFYLVVSQGDIVSFVAAFPVLAREGGISFRTPCTLTIVCNPSYP